MSFCVLRDRIFSAFLRSLVAARIKGEWSSVESDSLHPLFLLCLRVETVQGEYAHHLDCSASYSCIVCVLLQERGPKFMPLFRSLRFWWASCEHGLQNLAKGGAINRFCCIDLRESSISILLLKSAFQGSTALSNHEFRGQCLSCN